MTIALASDHAGFALKQKVQLFLEDNGAKVKDFGCYNTESCDYPDFAHPLAEDIEAGVVSCGIAICGSGQGMAITLNKHHGVRAGLAWNVEIAHLMRQHNNANCIVFPGRFITNRECGVMIDEFLKTPFEAGRHQLRIDKI